MISVSTSTPSDDGGDQAEEGAEEVVPAEAQDEEHGERRRQLAEVTSGEVDDPVAR